MTLFCLSICCGFKPLLGFIFVLFFLQIGIIQLRGVFQMILSSFVFFQMLRNSLWISNEIQALSCSPVLRIGRPLSFNSFNKEHLKTRKYLDKVLFTQATDYRKQRRSVFFVVFFLFVFFYLKVIFYFGKMYI